MFPLVKERKYLLQSGKLNIAITSGNPQSHKQTQKLCKKVNNDPDLTNYRQNNLG